MSRWSLISSGPRTTLFPGEASSDTERELDAQPASPVVPVAASPPRGGAANSMDGPAAGGGGGRGSEHARTFSLGDAAGSTLGDIEASVVSWTKTEQGVVVYNIEVRYSDGRGRKLIRRRYSDFLKLHETLKKHPEVASFTFPGKISLSSEAEVAKRRRQRFDEYLKLVLGLRKAAPEVMDWILSFSSDDGIMFCVSLGRFCAHDLSDLDDVLHIEAQPLPSPAPSEVLIQVCASVVLPSDVGSIKGVCHPLPRPPCVTGHSFCGMVVDGPLDLLGKMVVGCGNFSTGTHTQFLTVPETHVCIKPACLPVACAAAVAQPMVVAAAAIDTHARVTAEDTVCVLGAGTGEGRAAVQLAKFLGAASVIAVVDNELDGAEAARVADLVLDVSQVKGTPQEDPTVAASVRRFVAEEADPAGSGGAGSASKRRSYRIRRGLLSAPRKPNYVTPPAPAATAAAAAAADAGANDERLRSGVDVVLDCTATGRSVERACGLARENGRVVVIAPPEPPPQHSRACSLDMGEFLAKRLQLHTVSAVALDPVAAVVHLQRVLPGLDDKRLHAPALSADRAFGLEDAIHAFRAAADGGPPVIITPSGLEMVDF